MEAKELRIGNWFSNGIKNYRADANTIYDLYLAEENGNSDLWQPVRLTEDIILKCGFHRNNNALVPENFIDDDNKFYFTIWNMEGSYIYKYNSSEFDVELTSLHQLQNLFFALTGEELNITL